MSLRERTSSLVGEAKRAVYENKKRVVHSYRMSFNSDYRTDWLKGELSKDLAIGVVTQQQCDKILEQSKDPKTSRHFGETFIIPLVAGVAGGVGSLQVFNYAVETGDPLAWSYTLSHLALGVPKLSISSGLRGLLLTGSVIVDHIQDRQVGSWSRIGSELSAIGASSISWMGAGNGGPGFRMAIHAPDFGPYTIGKLAKKISEPERKKDTPTYKYFREFGYCAFPTPS